MGVVAVRNIKALVHKLRYRPQAIAVLTAINLTDHLAFLIFTLGKIGLLTQRTEGNVGHVVAFIVE